MDQPEQTVRVGSTATRDTLLARLEAMTDTSVVLRVTRDATVPRSIEDFQALKSLARRRRLRLRIESPVASVVGLAKIYDIEAEFDASVGKTGALPTTEPAPASPPPRPLTPLPPPAPPPPLTPLPSPSPTGPLTTPPAADIPSAALDAAPSDNDWLFGGLDVDSIESDFATERGRSAAPPPPEFLAGAPAWTPPPLPLPPAPPADFSPPAAPEDVPPPALDTALGEVTPHSDNDWLFGGLDVETIESDFAAERGRSAAPPPEFLAAGPTLAPEPPAPEHTLPPPAAAAPPPMPPELPPVPAPVVPTPAPLPTLPPAPAERDPLQSSLFLPDWLRTIPTVPESTSPSAAAAPPPAVPAPTPAEALAPPPLFAHGGPTKPGPRWTVPCPHCGEPMDLEQLIQKADYQD